jgi:hypothetical protein
LFGDLDDARIVEVEAGDGELRGLTSVDSALEGRMATLVKAASREFQVFDSSARMTLSFNAF